MIHNIIKGKFKSVLIINNMQIFVKDPSGLTQSLYVEDGSLVADLK